MRSAVTQRRIYQDEYPYFVTWNTLRGESWFEATKHAELLCREIFTSAKLKGFDILAFQIMPNHVHMLVMKRTLESVRSGNGNNITAPKRTFSKVREYNISDLMQSIKGNFSRKVGQGNVWQRRFYTKIVTTPKYLTTVVEYMRNNPIKDELPKKYERKPYQYINPQKIGALIL